MVCFESNRVAQHKCGETEGNKKISSNRLPFRAFSPTNCMPAPKDFDLESFLATRTQAVNRALHRFLPSEKAKPATIHKAMRYSLFAGGKRMRPAILLAAAEACGVRG
jgi:hypothetical protein